MVSNMSNASVALPAVSAPVRKSSNQWELWGRMLVVPYLLIFFIFAFLATEMYSPQVLLLSALIITLLLQILTLPEALAGTCL